MDDPSQILGKEPFYPLIIMRESTKILALNDGSNNVAYLHDHCNLHPMITFIAFQLIEEAVKKWGSIGLSEVKMDERSVTK